MAAGRTSDGRATAPTETRAAGRSADGGDRPSAGGPRRASDYELPLVHMRVPKPLGEAALWVGIAGAVVVGAVELPVAALVAAGVVVARHGDGGR